jgi:serralysin
MPDPYQLISVETTAIENLEHHRSTIDLSPYSTGTSFVTSGIRAFNIYTLAPFESIGSSQAHSYVVQGGSGNDTYAVNGLVDHSFEFGSDLFGYSGHDRLTGSQFNDRLFGGEGNDTLDGVIGQDTLNGGAGDDHLWSNTVNGTGTFIGGAGTDQLVLGRGAYTGTVFEGIERLSSVQSGTADDTVTFIFASGDAGSHYYDGGEGFDHITLDSTGISESLSFYTGSGTYAFSLRSGNFSYGRFIGEDYTIMGGTGDDRFTLSGVLQDSELYGNSGHDQLTGGAGNDRLFGGRGADTLAGGVGQDRLTGNSGNDTLFGDQGNDNLLGGGRNDSLFGGDGRDTLKGQKGRDELSGDNGSDTLLGGGGNDSLSGGASHDILHGQKGRDVLTGGSGRDAFVFNRGDGHDTITDFEVGIDHIQIGRGASRLRQLDFEQQGDDVLVSFRNVEITVEEMTVSEIADSENFLFV